VIPYRATLDVPEETLTQLIAWIIAHRKALGTRKGRRRCSPGTQAVLVLRWFRDDTSLRMLVLDAHLPISTTYRYLHEGITILAGLISIKLRRAKSGSFSEGSGTRSTARSRSCRSAF
jgi:hypothetical protein